MKIKVFTVGKKIVAEIPLPKALGAKPNLVLLSQAIKVYQDRRHPGTAKVKTRGEVAISTRKIYRQKGTGGARHGAKSAPIFVGGGVAHGPKGIKRVLTLSRKMRRMALTSALALKASRGELVLVEGLKTLSKTKQADQFLQLVKQAAPKVKRMSLVVGQDRVQIRKVLGNLPGLKILGGGELNAYDLFLGGLIIAEKDLFVSPKKI